MDIIILKLWNNTQEIWQITISDYIEICNIAKEAGVQPGESIEQYIIDYMKEKNIKPIGHTELTKNEWITENVSKGHTVLDGNIDNKGKLTFKKHKKIDNE